MENKRYLVDSSKAFSKSLIWQINRDFYEKEGVDAWRNSTVPHQLTSNAMVGKTYAELIFSFLRDLTNKGQNIETVYILELGAGHGRLAFHILKHLEKLRTAVETKLPPYCYILSDISEKSLDFFLTHPQFQVYFEKGILDVAYFDGTKSTVINLRHSKIEISPSSLDQAILAIGNYFFDSIPNEVFLVKDKTISACHIALESENDPKGMNEETLLKNLQLVYDKLPLTKPYYEQDNLNVVLDAYKNLLSNSHIYFPAMGLQCIDNIKQLSKKGLMLITMDKGFHEIRDLKNGKEPDIVTHGSYSVWVNYHAFAANCENEGGIAMFPSYSTFHLELGCLLFLSEPESYQETKLAYKRFVDDYGPDDFNSIKRSTYQNLSQLTLMDLIGLLRLSSYDSTLFHNILPRLKQVGTQISFKNRRRYAQTMHKVWDMYFTIYENFDLPYELGGIFYDLGFYKEAINYFDYSVNLFGPKADIFYNRALCYYQLREDQLFLKTITEAKKAFPNFERFAYLDTLDLNA